MKTRLLAILIAAATALTCNAQTVKTLGYGTNYAVIGPATTNALVWSNRVTFVNTVSVQDWTFSSSAIGWGGNDLFNGEELAVYGAWNFNSAPTFSEPAATLTNLGVYATNAKAVTFAGALFDATLEQKAMWVEDADMAVSTNMVRTNGPTNVTNATRWIRTLAGTNVFFIPLYK